MSLTLWQTLAGAFILVASLFAAGHAVLHKRDVRAAIGWVAVILLTPVFGTVAYALLGVNRIRRRALALGPGGLRGRPAEPPVAPLRLPPAAHHLDRLAHLGDQIVRNPLVSGSRLTLLPDGGETYPAMLAAIEGAKRTVTLSTYIFDRGAIGDAFIEALTRARWRGVQVRVLVDAVGARYAWPPAHSALRMADVPVALFLPRISAWLLPTLNLRNHRKVLVADGKVGFTGGFNIRDEYAESASRPAPSRDLHLKVEGPLVAQLQSAFAEDWRFATGEELDGVEYFPGLPSPGDVLGRAVPDGPDEDFETIRWLLFGALGAARSSIRIVTPYFLPDPALVIALDAAALRGVEVDIVLPERSNLPVVGWAQTAQLWQVLQQGCRVWLSPPPFDHTKMMVVDGCWSLLGSSNWDPRSLRLNFELDVECYDAALAGQLESLVRARIERARPVTLAEVDGRTLPVRLRDGVARLFSPYL
ncbi:MAG TPA: phospholipase D-like domain-containing protein [Anaeromyxobacteraceae bacterium]|nr:phospholipase D-like domain-containing protein [Anaeromyxobacteraceae bacterium]